MGSTWSSSSFLSSSSPSTSLLEIKDVLALCEDGDLLLAREKLADSALRVGVEFVVARDIQRMQRGQFPAQRVTSLPPWTSCELLLRHEGALHVVSIGANGVQFVPFEERVASKMFHIHDRTLLFPTTKMSPRSPRQQSVDHEAVVEALKEIPPVIQRLFKRMLELFYQGLKLDDNTSKPSSSNSPQTHEDTNVGTELPVALDALGVAEVAARLSAAFVAAAYELVHLLDPITTTKSDPLVPAAFWSNSNDNERLVFTPPTALGSEMALNNTPG
ncbi:hypothetical protein PC116_g1243 [Phytophthora cactorum]|uniref:Uncharacterized protein n=1 Tax=Phytophthora cactorum TaxID=29920 RepID=A0A8T0ZXL1_9STRA|nr:hypothetical protein PC113_g1231 [Phytophthora cactorum]KAG2989277.1 hypothetical protein PC118_g6255 [Phytophthora cactorum]KAG3037270.1 hypothetical protein PC119_g3771 [Phytophthora cactorum]KAG4251029.1 hypothetical protein PC116_g1243 [Phytophthora cactorum]